MQTNTMGMEGEAEEEEKLILCIITEKWNKNERKSYRVCEARHCQVLKEHTMAGNPK